jgi:hypothetical protein
MKRAVALVAAASHVPAARVLKPDATRRYRRARPSFAATIGGQGGDVPDRGVPSRAMAVTGRRVGMVVSAVRPRSARPGALALNRVPICSGT